MGCVYEALNLVNGKRYVGKTNYSIEHRKNGHFSKSKMGSKHHFHNALRKYGEDNFVWFVLETSDDELLLFELEKQYIAFAREEGIELYNMTDGGEGPSGRIMPKEVREKISSSLKGEKSYWFGKQFSKKQLANMSAAQRGKKHSEETKAKISASLQGRPISEEHRANLSAANTGIKRSEETKKKVSITKRTNNLNKRLDKLATVTLFLILHDFLKRENLSNQETA